MLITKTPAVGAAAPAAPAPGKAAGAPAPAVARDALALSGAEPPKAPAQEPMNAYESAVKKTAVIGTIAGGVAITTTVGVLMAMSMGPTGWLALAACLAADGLMGLLAYHVWTTKLAKDGAQLKG